MTEIQNKHLNEQSKENHCHEEEIQNIENKRLEIQNQHTEEMEKIKSLTQQNKQNHEK